MTVIIKNVFHGLQRFLNYLIVLAMILPLANHLHADDLKLWFNSPGTNCLSQGLLIGNGRMGGIVLGNPTNESIALNESSLWTGDTNPGGDYASTGAYQLFGNLLLKLPTHTGASNYRRERDQFDFDPADEQQLLFPSRLSLNLL